MGSIPEKRLFEGKLSLIYFFLSRETQIIITNKLHTRLWRIQEVIKMFSNLTKLRYYRQIFQSFQCSLRIFSRSGLLQIALPLTDDRVQLSAHFDHLLTSPGSTSVYKQLHLAQKKFSNGHVTFLHISTERNTDKAFYQTIILHKTLKQKEYRKFDYCLC